MPQRWIFTEAPDRDGWSWRTITPDGGIARVSRCFSDYGTMVSDAIRQGFKPALEHWVVISLHGTTRVEPGMPPVNVPAGSGLRRSSPDLEGMRNAAIERPDPPEMGSEAPREPGPR